MQKCINARQQNCCSVLSYMTNWYIIIAANWQVKEKKEACGWINGVVVAPPDP